MDQYISFDEWETMEVSAGNITIAINGFFNREEYTHTPTGVRASSVHQLYSQLLHWRKIPLFMDFAALEAKVLALMEEPVDIHTQRAEMEGVSRDTAKRLNFLRMYGGSVSSRISSQPSKLGESVMRSAFLDHLSLHQPILFCVSTRMGRLSCGTTQTKQDTKPPEASRRSSRAYASTQSVGPREIPKSTAQGEPEKSCKSCGNFSGNYCSCCNNLELWEPKEPAPRKSCAGCVQQGTCRLYSNCITPGSIRQFYTGDKK